MRRLRQAAAAATGVAAVYTYHRRSALPKSPVVLSLDLSSADSDKATQDAVQAIKAAAEDPAVAGLVTHLGGTSPSLATTQELGAAIKTFRARKGPDTTFAYAPQYSSTSAYVLACKHGYVCQQPGTSLRVPGISMTLPFIGGLLERWGLRLDVFESGPLKSGLSAFSERGPTREQAKNAESLAESSYAMMVREIAAERGVSERAVKRLAMGSWWTIWIGIFGYARERGWLSAEEAKRAKLLDASLYLDKFDEMTSKRCQTSATMGLKDYHQARVSNAQLDLLFERLLRPAFGAALSTCSSIDGALAFVTSDETYRLAPKLCELAGKPMPPPTAVGGAESEASVTTALSTSLSSLTTSVSSALASTDAASAAAADAYTWLEKQLQLIGQFKLTPPKAEPTIGVIHMQGPILPATVPPPKSGGGLGKLLGKILPAAPPAAPPSIHVETVRAQLRAAKADPSVRAVVLRIDSPGGDAVASDAIRREVELLRAAGKPVIASMGRTCASGGYLIASSCDRVLALPATLTGSIGAISGVLDASPLLRKHRINVCVVSAGAKPYTAAKPLTRSQRKELATLTQRVSADFEAKVASGRGMSRRKVRSAAAGGRVWTGEQAIRNGLVDQLGSLSDACDVAFERAGIGASSRRPLLAKTDFGSWAPVWATALTSLVSAADGMRMGSLMPSELPMSGSLPRGSLLGDAMAVDGVAIASEAADSLNASFVVLLAAELPSL